METQMFFQCLQRRIELDFSVQFIFCYGLSDSPLPFGSTAVVQVTPGTNGHIGHKKFNVARFHWFGNFAFFVAKFEVVLTGSHTGCDSSLDQRVYNLPSSSDIVAIWIEENDGNAIWAPHIQICTYRVIDVLRLGERDASNIGKRRFLSNSFIGGPRDMRQRYMDAIALVQHFDKHQNKLTPFSTYLISTAKVRAPLPYGLAANTFEWVVDRFTVVEQIKEDNTDDPPLPTPTRINTISLANLEQEPRHVEFDVLAVVVSYGAIKFAGIHGNKCRQIVIMDANHSDNAPAKLFVSSFVEKQDALQLPPSSASVDVGESSKRELDNASSPDELKRATTGSTSSKKQQLECTTS
ncbi:hypothetical protein BC332_30810 [Capsicum chinense]|nr:hypothetical protein BC332_30810 [Capsicum chinense]